MGRRTCPIDVSDRREVRKFWKCVDRSPGLGPQGTCWEWTQGALEQHIADGCSGHHGAVDLTTALRAALAAIRKDLVNCQINYKLHPDDQYVRGRIHGLEAALFHLEEIR